MNFKDTKYSGFGGHNTAYELQEVKEQTIQEEENEQATIQLQSGDKRVSSKVTAPNQSKVLNKKQAALAK